jgi:hypothetical protein
MLFLIGGNIAQTVSQMYLRAQSCFRSQKRVIKRFRNYIIKGADSKELFTPPPVAFDAYESDGEGDIDSGSGDNDETMEQKANAVQKKLKMKQHGQGEKKDSSER